MPVIIISVLNLMIPTLTKWHTLVERYDFPETQLKMEIWRSYISKMFNLFLFLVLNMPNFSKALNISNIIKSDQIDDNIQCGIDVATSNIMRLAFSEIFILFVTQFGKAGFYYVLYYRILGK